MDSRIVHMMDQFQAALKEVFAERGYDVEIKLPDEFSVAGHQGLGFLFCAKGHKRLYPELLDSVINEAANRIGMESNIKNADEEFDEGEEWKRGCNEDV